MAQEFDKTTWNVTHDKDNKRFTLNIHGILAKVTYAKAPSNLRRQGYGKILAEKPLIN